MKTPQVTISESPIITSYQSDFADAPAGDDFVRGSLDEELRFPTAPVRDPVVMEWEYLTEPRLTTSHDAVSRAIASYFTRDGGWVYLTQDVIAAEARLSRQIVNMRVPDLAAVGRMEVREVTTSAGHRGLAYRLTGEDTGWRPDDLGMPGRMTVKDFEVLVKIRQLEGALLDAVSLVGDGQVLPDSVIAVVESIPERRGRDSENFDNNGALSTEIVDSAPDRSARSGWKPATEAQAASIAIHQERTGLLDAEVMDAWREVQPGGTPPLALGQVWLTKHQGDCLIRWLRRQSDAPAPVVDLDFAAAEAPHECSCDAAAATAAGADTAAAWIWERALGLLEKELPRASFDRWLKGSHGVRLKGNILYVRVDSEMSVRWLERRMHQGALWAVRSGCGPESEVRFEASTPDCPVHGEDGRGDGS